METIKIIVKGRLPSWNAVLGMNHWGRVKLKKEIQQGLLSELRACEQDSSTKITCAKNTTLTPADTLDYYIQTTQAKRKLQLANARLKKENQKKSLSK